jgi:biotin carboxyl carrier protein
VKYYVDIDGNTLEIQFAEQGEQLAATLGDETMLLDLHRVTDPSLFSMIVDNQSHEVLVERTDEGFRVLVGGALFHVRVQDEWERRLASIQRKDKVDTGQAVIRAPMPGVVITVKVEPGEEIAPGAALVILSAMKMENEIRSPRGGVVQIVHAEAGQKVEQGAPLVTLE